MIRDKLLEMMNYRNMNMQQLSDASGLSIDTIKNLIYGRVVDPKLSTLIPLCDALNCSLDNMMGRGRISLQQARDFPNHSVSLIERIIDIEYALLCKSNAKQKSFRTVIIPNRFTTDNMLYDSCNIGYIDVTSILPQYSNETITCGIYLSGNELDPVYFAGDILLINGDRHPKSGEIGIFLAENKHLYVRRYHYNGNGSGSLIPLIPNRSIISTKGHKFVCFGTVLSVYRGEMSYLSPNFDSELCRTAPDDYDSLID